MYIPYLRARQFELIALRELVEQHKLGKDILPLVEPVKLTPTLILTIEAFIGAEQPIAVILNPTVGSFSTNGASGKEDKLANRFASAMTSDFVQKTLIWDTKGREYLKEWEGNGFNRTTLMLIIQDRDALDLYMEEFSHESTNYVLIPDQGTFRRSINNPKIILQDQFTKQKKNADYSKVEDEFFSDAHLFYKDEGYVGFADYSIIGNEYNEGGFAPYAAAIHLVYFDNKNKLRIHHFVSDSIEDIQDTPGKFFEAVEKLAAWVKINNVQLTIGLKKLLKHYEEGSYPGLGTVKKLSIMHHLELISAYLIHQK